MQYKERISKISGIAPAIIVTIITALLSRCKDVDPQARIKAAYRPRTDRYVGPVWKQTLERARIEYPENPELAAKAVLDDGRLADPDEFNNLLKVCR